jgi:predicted secreted Zn-dependent protease
MAKFLCSVASRDLRPSGLTNIQICFSSRPLQVFLDHFDQVPRFYMQNNTDKDIDIVMDTMMRDNRRMLRHFESSEEQSREMANALATEIFSRAEGDRMERLEELIRGKSATSLNT